MNKPNPEPLDLAQLVNLANATMKDAKFPQLATIDGDQPRLRPVSPVRTDGFTIYVANLRTYGKTRDIEANPKVELCYMDSHHNQVRITGIAEVVKDRELLEDLWVSNPLLRNYLGSIDNPELIVYKVVPNRVSYMQEWALEYHNVPLNSSGILS
jgi:general stress protein 26